MNNISWIDYNKLIQLIIIMAFTEKDLQKMMKNKHISISSNNEKIIEVNHQKEETKSIKIKKKSKTVVDFDKVCQSIKDSRVEFQYSENEFIIILHGARILSTNQIYAFLQKKSSRNSSSIPFYIVKYKAVLEAKIREIMQEVLIFHHQNKVPLPTFNLSNLNDKKVKVFLYRQSQRLLDEDNMYGAFKYIIDCLRKTYTLDGINLSYTLLEDDNKKIISTIETYQVKNKENAIAVKLVLDDNYKEISSLDEFKTL